MTWNPKGLSSLPKILAGPIVRKTTEKEVSVWVALKSGEDLTLNVYSPVGQIIKSVTATPIRLGDNLFVLCLTAKDSNSFLSQNQTYGYNIVNSLGEDFFTPNFVDKNGIGAITYLSSPTFGSLGRLPTFILPDISLDGFRIIHGSCRKPHGEGLDGLSTLSDLINESLSTPSYKRPQMLFLTGDQVYSDDVSDALLHMIRAYTPTLFNWNEYHPSIPNVNDSNLNPGYRNHYIMDIMKFPTTRDACKSHLIRFQEFIVMYIMAWSPSLWRDDPTGTVGPIESSELPEFSEVLPNESQYEEDFDFEGLLMTKSKNYSESTIYSKYQNEIEQVANFKKTLSIVRKALANIPTYMIFDDHEVTDDWFLNYKWCENALIEGSLQRRVIQNGMSAYAICQGWGNTPEQFELGEPGRLLLSNYQFIADNHNIGVNPNVWETDIGNIILPYLNAPSLSLKHRPSGALKYNWVYRGENFEVIATDTRTQRGFIGLTLDKGYSSLLGEVAIDEQIRNIGGDKKDLTILLSGTPLYGSGTVEESIAAVRWSGYKTSPELDLESWNISESARHSLLSALATRAKPPANSSDPIKHKVIVLSGDVHYGFTNRLEYTASSTFKFSLSNVEMVVVQCCASSLKNQLSPSGFLESAARLTTVGWHRHDPDDLFLFKSYDNFTHWGYNNENGNQVINITVDGAMLVPIKTTSKVHDKPFIISSADYIKNTVDAVTGVLTRSLSAVVPTTNPDWKIVQQSIKAYDLSSVIPAYTAGIDPNEYFDQSSKHQDNYFNGGKGGRYIVGYNQIGEVLLRWPHPDPVHGNLLDHRIWWRNRKQNQNALLEAYPLSIFVVKLD